MSDTPPQDAQSPPAAPVAAAAPGAASGPSGAPLRTCWVVTDGRAGIENQALGLAEAIARRMPLDIMVKRIIVTAPWRMLPRALWGDPFARLGGEGALLRPPYPDLWIACGRLSTPLTMAVKARAPETFTVQLQDPRAPSRAFDLIIPPTHDRVRGPNVFPIIGAANRVTRERIAAEAALLEAALGDLPRPRVAVLIGGPNRIYRYTERQRRFIAKELRALADCGAGVMATPSRRTEPATVRALESALDGAPHFLWDGAPVAGLDNPYFAMLGLADYILVTADSVNMATEAAMTGKPVQFLALERAPYVIGQGKFGRFRRALRLRRAARAFTGRLRRWSYEPLDETARAADEVIRRFIASRT